MDKATNIPTRKEVELRTVKDWMRKTHEQRMAQEATPPALPCRDPAAIDTELLATVRTYLAASKAGVHELTLMPIVARVAALAWVLHPELNEVGAQGYAWELIASVKMEEGL